MHTSIISCEDTEYTFSDLENMSLKIVIDLLRAEVRMLDKENAMLRKEVQAHTDAMLNETKESVDNLYSAVQQCKQYVRGV